jgi:AraC family transcriptional regulator, transcriptional activator of pobA
MKSGKNVDELLKLDFSKFFIVKVEDMIRQIKLPVPPNRATTHTFIYLTSGNANMNIGSSSFNISKDECLIVPAGQVFSFNKLDVNTGFLCNFHNDIIIGKFGNGHLLKDFEFLSVYGNPHIRLDKQTSKQVLQLLQRIYADYSASGLKNIDIIQSYFIALLCELNLIYKPLSNSKQISAINITNKFKQLLFSNIRQKHLVADYAAMMNITPNHLNKAVKAITSRSPTKWIAETLVLEAKVLLYQTTHSINEIASGIGIYDQSYFSRLFKKYEGITPLEFRKWIEKS